jgi:predicted nuclease of predicted toxin-antitoxin system
VKFLVDAQLPVRLALLLNGAGHEAIHTSDLPNGNASTDAQVVEIADAQDRQCAQWRGWQWTTC